MLNYMVKVTSDAVLTELGKDKEQDKILIKDIPKVVIIYSDNIKQVA